MFQTRASTNSRGVAVSDHLRRLSTGLRILYSPMLSCAVPRVSVYSMFRVPFFLMFSGELSVYLSFWNSHQVPTGNSTNLGNENFRTSCGLDISER